MIIKVWDMSMPNGRQCVATLSGHTRDVLSVAALSWLVSCSYDQTIRGWDPGKPAKNVARRRSTDIAKRWCLDNGWLVSCSSDHKIKLWDITGGDKFSHDNG